MCVIFANSGCVSLFFSCVITNIIQLYVFVIFPTLIEANTPRATEGRQGYLSKDSCMLRGSGSVQKTPWQLATRSTPSKLISSFEIMCLT